MTLTELKELRDRVRGLTGADGLPLADEIALWCMLAGCKLVEHRSGERGLDGYWTYLLLVEDASGRRLVALPEWQLPGLSTDASLAFSEKVLPGWMVEYMGQQAHGSPGSLVGFGWCVELSDSSESRSKQGQAPALPLAIIDATLTALIETME